MSKLDSCSEWQLMTDSLLLRIFSNLEALDLLHRAAQVCKAWNRVANDEALWKNLVYKDWKIKKTTPPPSKMESWQKEYKRFKYHTPLVETEVLTDHSDEVLHVTFSHNGKMFSSCSKDGFVKVWSANHPATVRHSADMKEYGWEHTRFSEFNKSDTLLLVSGSLLCGEYDPPLGEIIVFNVHGEFTLQSRVLTNPSDIYGAWYNDTHFISAYLTPLHLVFSSIISLNSVCSETNASGMDETSETESIGDKLFRFCIPNGSSVRFLMVADWLSTESCIGGDTSELKTVNHMENVNTIRGNSLHNVSAESANGSSLCKMGLTQQSSHPNDTNGMQKIRHDDLDGMESLKLKASVRLQGSSHQGADSIDGSSLISLGKGWKGDNLNSDMDMKNCAASGLSESYNRQSHSSQSLLTCAALMKQGYSLSVEHDERQFLDRKEKYLIFTTGTGAPHQIGIKKIKPFRFTDKVSQPLLADLTDLRQSVRSQDSALNYMDRASAADRFDEIDYLIDMQGQIIGMALSPDQRYLYVNCRAWPKDYVIDDPFESPPISQEIKMHVIDLVTMKKVGTTLRSHKGYTTSDTCFYMFLDVCDKYAASGSEDKHGYLWDRHYGCCIARFLHSDVVNSVAFNPSNPEMLVTASDDFTLKIWRSKNRANEMKARMNKVRSLNTKS